MTGTLDLVHAFEELAAARPGYEESDAMYAGEVGEVYASEKVRRLIAKAKGDQVEEFNYAHIPVDTVANRLEITSVTVVRDDEDETGDPSKEADGGVRTNSTGTAPTPAAKGEGQSEREAAPAEDGKGGRYDEAQAALDQLRKDNQLDAEADGLHLKASKNGDCYLIVWPSTDDGGQVTAVDMRVNTALTTRVIYDQEDPLKVAYAIKSWTYDDVDPDGMKCQYTRATMYYDDRVERWITKPNVKGAGLCDKDNWLPYEPRTMDADSDDRDPAVIEHSYGRVPVFHFRNDRPYGRPEHLYAYGPQQLLNKLVQAAAVAVDYQMFPQRFALMDPAADQPMTNFLDPNHPEDDDDPEGDGNVSNLSADPSAVWRIYGATKTGQYDPATPDTFLKPFDRFVQAMAELTETPLYRFGSAFAQTPSGAAQRAADASTVNKVENRQVSYDSVWEDAYEFALMLLGFNDVKVSVGWKPAEQSTDFEAWSVVQQKVDAGVPQRQALMEAGYPAEQVDEWLSGEVAAHAALLRKVDTINAVANAFQSLGAAAAMGVITPEQIQALVGTVLGDGGDEPPDAAPPAEPPPAKV